MLSVLLSLFQLTVHTAQPPAESPLLRLAWALQSRGEGLSAAASCFPPALGHLGLCRLGRSAPCSPSGEPPPRLRPPASSGVWAHPQADASPKAQPVHPAIRGPSPTQEQVNTSPRNLCTGSLPCHLAMPHSPHKAGPLDHWGGGGGRGAAPSTSDLQLSAPPQQKDHTAHTRGTPTAYSFGDQRGVCYQTPQNISYIVTSAIPRNISELPKT